MKHKFCINLFVDQLNDNAGFFLIGEYDNFKMMLEAAAYANDDFANALIDAALEYANNELERLNQE